MAIWQFEFFIFPKDNCTFGMDLDDIVTWEGFEVNTKIDFLPKAESFDPNSIEYGDANETSIEFYSENGQILDIRCKMDLTTITEDLFEKLVAYINSQHGMILHRDHVIEPKKSELIKLIRESSAYRYCSNQAQFIKDFVDSSETLY